MRPHLGPILRATLRQRGAVALVVVQVALGFLITVRSAQVGRFGLTGLLARSGTDEDALLVVEVQAAGEEAGQAADLARLRGLPGVRAASFVDTDPLGAVVRAPDALRVGGGPLVGAVTVGGGEGLAEALGATLVAGRDFVAGDGEASPVPALVPRGLLPGEAVGLRFHSREVGDAVVVGVLDRLVLKPTRGTVESGVLYARPMEPAAAWRFVVRAEPGQREALRAAIPAALAGERAVRATPAGVYRHGVLDATRHSLLVVAGVIAIIIVVIGIGQFAVAMFLVQERTRQIGLRRALGATRGDILLHFMLESLLVTLAGLGLGLVLHTGMDLLLGRIVLGLVLNPWVTLAGAVLLVLIGQIATFVPAYRAASIAPSVASRTA